jgi:hypothetical protein
LTRIERNDGYFEGDDPKNTDEVVAYVKKRVELTSIRTVIVASHSGATALKFAKALEGKAKIICVCGPPQRREWNAKWPVLDVGNREKLEQLGVDIIDKAPYAFHNSILEEWVETAASPEKLVRETLYSLGPGFKVAVEVALMAVACGLVSPYTEVIAVGGTERGADTAIVLRTTYPATMFSRDEKKHLRIREIVTMRRS